MGNGNFDLNLNLDGQIGGGAPAGRGQQGEKAISSGFSTAIKGSGIIGILNSLTIVTDTISITLGLISTILVQMIGLLGLGVAKLIQFGVNFFDDPSKALIKFGLFLVNGIISGIEFIVNTIRGIFGAGNIELPRFQLGLVEQAFDNFKENSKKVAEDGEVTLAESFNISKQFFTDLKDSFLTESEFLVLAQEKRDEAKNLEIQSLEIQQSFADAVIASANRTGLNYGSMFSELNALSKNIKNQARILNNNLGGRRGAVGPSTPKEAFELSRLQTTTLSNEEARRVLSFQLGN